MSEALTVKDSITKMAVVVNPFAPLALDSTTMWQAVVRVAIFGGATYTLWGKHRKAAYVTGALTAISILTTLSAKHGT
jgi:hypothetical protein